MQAFAFFASLADFPSALQIALEQIHKTRSDAQVKYVSQSQSGSHPDETSVCMTIFYE